MDVILWALRAFGINSVPSTDILKKLDRQLQELYGIRTHRYEGALGHVYYMNNLSDMIAQVIMMSLNMVYCEA
jgi:hypothetical protein